MEKKTWLPPTAGILDIISGSFGLFAGIILLVLGTLGSGLLRLFEVGIPEISPAVILALLSAIAIPLIIAGILAIVGGIYALQRKMWGLALAGSIAAFFPSWLLGMAAIIFTALSKNEFE
jgi:hypothetical protein